MCINFWNLTISFHLKKQCLISVKICGISKGIARVKTGVKVARKCCEWVRRVGRSKAVMFRPRCLIGGGPWALNCLLISTICINKEYTTTKKGSVDAWRKAKILIIRGMAMELFLSSADFSHKRVYTWCINIEKLKIVWRYFLGASKQKGIGNLKIRLPSEAQSIKEQFLLSSLFEAKTRYYYLFLTSEY